MATEKNVKSHQLVLPPCKVCGSQASGYHYGVISCEACKIFFRRSLDMKHPYKCKKNDQCLLLPNLKTPCSHCRLQKCLDLGMCKEGIKRGRYSCQKKNMALKEIREFEEKLQREKEEEAKKMEERWQELQAFVDRLVQLDRQYPLFEPEFLATIPERHARILEYRKAKEEVFGPMKPLSYSIYQDVYRSTGIDIDGRRHKLEDCGKAAAAEIYTFVEFAKRLPGFSEIDSEDQVLLVKETIWDWYLISALPLIDCEHKLLTCSSCGYTFTEEDYELYNDNTCLPTHALAKFVKSLNFTSEELTVIKALMVFFPDGCEKMYNKRDVIEKCQYACVEALQYLFEKNRSPSEIPKLWGGIVHYWTESQGTFHKHHEARWYAMFPDLDYPDLLLEFYGPIDKTRVELRADIESPEITSDDRDDLCSAINLTL